MNNSAPAPVLQANEEFGTFPRGFSRATRFQWPLIPAGELVDLSYGKSLVEAERIPGPIPVYGTNGRCGWHNKALVKGPGVILGRKGMGPLGVDWCAVDFWVIDTAYSVSPKRKDIDLRYIYYVARYTGLNHLKDGTSNPSLSRARFYIQRFPVPPYAEQLSIVRVLSVLDDKIDLNHRMNQTLEALARAIFKSWFVDRERVSGQWRHGRVEDLVTLQRNTLDPSSAPDEVFDHYSIPAFDAGGVPVAEAGENIKSSKLLVPEGPILISKLNPRIPRVWRPNLSRDRRSIASTEFLAATPRLYTFDRDYIYSLFCSASFAQVFASHTTGTSGSHQRVRPSDLLRIECVVPDPQSRKWFSDTVKPFFDKVAANIAESLTLASLRDALLPKLLSGEIRVNQAEKIVGEVA